MRTVILFTRKHCHLCDAAREVIERVRKHVYFELIVVDIDATENEGWLDEYDVHVPVVHIDGVEFARHRIDEKSLGAAL